MKTSLVVFICALVFSLLRSESFAQGVIVGKVSDVETTEGLPGANVQIEGTVMGASTNVAGAFIIRRVPTGTYTVRITMLGYQRQQVSNVQVTLQDTAHVIVELKESPIEIDPVVVTASKWQQEADSTPAAIEVMTAKQILQRNPVRIEDALETAAGVQILQENVTIRGSDGYTFGVGSKVLVMIDGVPAANSDLGKVNWFLVSPPDVERVEIVRGAGSALYGSSAMGGVINFISKEPTPESHTYIRALLGSYDEPHVREFDYTDKLQTFNRQDFMHSRKIGDFGFRIAGSRSVSDNYVQNGDYKQYNLSGKVSYQFPNSSKLTLFGSYMNDARGVFTLAVSPSRMLEVPETELNKRQKSDGFATYARYTWPFAATASFDTRVYYNRFLLGTQATTEGTFSPAVGLGGTFQLQYIPLSNLSFIGGADWKFDKVKSSRDLYGQRDAILSAPYLQVDWSPAKDLNLQLGGRYDRYHIYSDTKAVNGQPRQYDHFSPKIGLNYHPFENTILRASYANGFKFPVVAQLFLAFDGPGFTFVESPDLRNEVSDTWEIGLRHKITPTWFIEANAFRTDVTDLIEVTIDVFNRAVRFSNIEDVRIDGLEFLTNGRWFNNHLGLKANLMLLNPEDRQLNKILPYRQRVLAVVSPSVRFNDVEFQIDYKYGSAQEEYQLSATSQIVPQKVWDGRVFFYINGQHTLFMGVNNIGNYGYTLRDLMMEEIRNFVIGYNVEF